MEITFTATDDCNNSSTCVATVYLDDTQVPSITCPADLTLECTVANDPVGYRTAIQAWIDGISAATDGCDGTVAITDNWNGTDVPSLSCDLSAGLEITFTATDDCNNSSTCVATDYMDDTK